MAGPGGCEERNVSCDTGKGQWKDWLAPLNINHQRIISLFEEGHEMGQANGAENVQSG